MKILFLFLLTSLDFFSQSKPDTSFGGFKVSYYQNGNPKSKIQYSKGKPNGFAIAYYDTKVIKEIGTYSNNRYVGNYTLCYEDGQVQQNLVFDKNGKKLGIQRYYHKNGFISVVAYFNDGKEIANINYNDKGEVSAKNILSEPGMTNDDTKELINSLIEIVEKENKKRSK